MSEDVREFLTGIGMLVAYTIALAMVAEVRRRWWR